MQAQLQLIRAEIGDKSEPGRFQTRAVTVSASERGTRVVELFVMFFFASFIGNLQGKLFSLKRIWQYFIQIKNN